MIALAPHSTSMSNTAMLFQDFLRIYHRDQMKQFCTTRDERYAERASQARQLMDLGQVARLTERYGFGR